MATSVDGAFLFDLDGTLVDSVYQHVLAWRQALEAAGIKLSVWRIHRRIGMSRGLFVNAPLRETGPQLTPEEMTRMPQGHRDTYAPEVAEGRSGEHTSGLQSPCKLVCR